MRQTLLALILFPVVAFSQHDYTKLVNPFIGTGGHGHTYPGATMPFGMMQLSPDTRPGSADWDGCSGYHYSDSFIYGFSHTHLSGTGIADYCDVLVMPFTGDIRWNNEDYRSPFSHRDEKAAPGYYEVLLQKNNIRAQLTTSLHSGMHQYIFPAGTREGSILIDLKHRDEVLECYIEKVNDHELRGFRRSKSWARNQYLYFYMVFEQRIETFFSNITQNQAQLTRVEGNDLKAAIGFTLPADGKLKVKIGISAVSTDGARQNLQHEIANWNFEEVHRKATQAWNKELGKIAIRGGTRDEQVSFYTALYHTMIVPNIFEDVDGKYRGTDLQVHEAKNFTNYTVFSLWDTYRAYHPLMTIINQQRTRDWVQTFLNQYRNGGMLPVWELAGNETFCMIGYHSVPVITDAYQKGLFKQNEGALLTAMRSYAESDRFGLPFYRRDGYLENTREPESVSKTLEYAYDDWCIAQFARLSGNDSVYRVYAARAKQYKNLFDPASGFMRGKQQGMWHMPLDPHEINNFFTEGNSWQYSFAVPQDISGLIRLHGGRQPFAAMLDSLFTTSSVTSGREQPDVTGFIGQYAHGNEPSHHMAYLYNYAAQPEKTQALIHRITQGFYQNEPGGLIGNEDCGQMSAWFVLSAMGFYPVCPGNGEYVLGTPLFDEVKIHLENGKTFQVNAQRKSPGAFYVNSTRLNGVPSTRSFIRHTDIMKGGKFEFVLDKTPGKAFGKSPEDLPHSSIEGVDIVAAPFFDMPGKKFRKSTTVIVRSVDSAATFYYSISNSPEPANFVPYRGPFQIDSTCFVHVYAKNPGGKVSAVVSQKFNRIPKDRSIKILSTLNPMYTAGGPDALIDSVEGSSNWKDGEWISSFGEDLDAVIEMQKADSIHYLGIHVLQDQWSWILYPKEVIFYSSEDGAHYKEVCSIRNTEPQQGDLTVMQTLGKAVNIQAKYIKVKVVNAGLLPAWHLSAGKPSHIFIDEIIIR